MQSYFTNRNNYKTGGEKRKRASGLDDESDNNQGSVAGGNGGGDEEDDSGPGEIGLMRWGGERGGGVTDEEDEEPLVKPRKRRNTATGKPLFPAPSLTSCFCSLTVITSPLRRFRRWHVIVNVEILY